MPTQTESKTPIALPAEDEGEAASRGALQSEVQIDLHADVDADVQIAADATVPRVVHAVRHHTPDHLCPVCGEKLMNEKCKVVCRSSTCVYRLVFNCTEY